MNEFLLTHGPYLSYLVITVVLILTGSGLPIPEEVPIIAAGVLSVPASDGTRLLHPFVALPCCLFGALVGDCIMYWIGYHFGRGVLREHRWWARCVTPEREARIEDMFERHGLKAFFVARFLVGLRTPVYLTAGILRVSFKKFVLIDLICATAVVGSFFALAYFFGEGIYKWIRRGEWGLTVGLVIAVACVAFFLWRRYRRKKLRSPTTKRLEDVLLPPTKKESPADKKDSRDEKNESPAGKKDSRGDKKESRGEKNESHGDAVEEEVM
jgi:membrane protein DedA with SNARE-associated domain